MSQLINPDHQPGRAYTSRADQIRSAVDPAKIEAALSASEARFRRALDTADIGTWSWDLMTGLGTLDERGAAIVGLGGAVVPDQPFDVAEVQRRSIHPDDLALVAAAVIEGIEKGATFVLRYRITASDGRLRHILSNVRVELDSRRRPIRLTGTNRDVTTEREADATLRRLNEELEQRVLEQTSEINALFLRVTSAHEEERRRIARNIHDQLGQQITALRLNIEALRAQANQDAALAQQIQRTMVLAEDLDQTIDFLAWELRPPALDDFGLSDALEHLINGWSERFEIGSAYGTVGTAGLRLPPDVEMNLYRIVQEALHNVYKHAQATHVDVMLEKRDHSLLLVVEDNGVGFHQEPRSKSGSLGLLHMNERACLIGGELKIDSTPGHGTTIVVRLPV